ncbi:MAG: hypothetical protein ACI4QD_08845 [Kiritimatiellia bacterium]
MATLLDISASVPQATVDGFLRACTRYQDELGNTQRTAIRRGTIALVKSLRARTAKSKKQAPATDITRADKPRYITPKGKNQKAQPAWKVRRFGSKGERFFIHPADSRAEARKKFAQYTKFGLAKLSWGWFMKTLFNRAIPGESANPRAQIDSRMIEGYIRESGAGKGRVVEVLIVNKLDYITAALPSSALEDSMRAATNSINTQINEGLAKARKELD